MFAQRLKELRRKRGLTQVQLAQQFNITKGAVGMWETGKREPDFETVNQIANFFHVTADYLLGNVNDPFFYLDTERIIRELNSYGDEDSEQKTPILVPEDEQDDMEKLLMSYVRDLTPDQKKMLLAQMQVMRESQKVSSTSSAPKSVDETVSKFEHPVRS